MTIEDKLSEKEILALAEKVENWKCINPYTYQGIVGECRIVVEERSRYIETMAGRGYEIPYEAYRIEIYLIGDEDYLEAIEERKKGQIYKIYQKLHEKTLSKEREERIKQKEGREKRRSKKIKKVKKLLKK